MIRCPAKKTKLPEEVAARLPRATDKAAVFHNPLVEL